MNRERKTAVIEEVATQIESSEAVFAIDYRGISVPQAAQLRARLEEADATLRVVKNTLTERAADRAGAQSLKQLLVGPTAFTFVRGDAALAAKAIASFRREHQVLAFKGGTLGGETLTIEQLESIARLPARPVLDGQLVGVLAAPITGLVRGLNQLIAGLALQLGQIAEQGLIGGGGPTADAESEAPTADAESEATPADAESEATTAEAESEATPAEAESEATPAEAEASAGDPADAPTAGEQPTESDETDSPPDGDDEN